MGCSTGHFITFEGIDGSGKSTQIQLLKERIEALGGMCHKTVEPSAGPVGSMLRQILSGRMKADEATLAALFAADRLDHLNNETDGICQKIQQGIHVLCDRYVLSNYAYQGVRVPTDWIMQMNSVALKTLRPDCHIFIDIDPELAIDRMAKARLHVDLYETRDRLAEVRDCYHRLIEGLKGQEIVYIINGNQSVDNISDEIWRRLSPIFE